MPSPFPGMDPYLEAPDIWPDFHNALGAETPRGRFRLCLREWARHVLRPGSNGSAAT
jgi:hypothetical protein